MLEDFKNTDNVWVYTSQNELNDAQISQIKTISNDFLAQWESHGAPVKGFIEVVENRFILVVADDCGGNMCGRAKDAQVRLIKSIEDELSVVLMDRMNLAYVDHDGEVQVVKMNEFKDLYKLMQITDDSVVFNNMVTNIEELQSNWRIPLKNSWHKQLV